MTPEPVPANKISLDIPVLIDGRKMSALVDTGADYSILSGKLASVLKKLRCPGMGHQFVRQVATLSHRLAYARPE